MRRLLLIVTQSSPLLCRSHVAKAVVLSVFLHSLALSPSPSPSLYVALFCFSSPLLFSTRFSPYPLPPLSLLLFSTPLTTAHACDASTSLLPFSLLLLSPLSFLQASEDKTKEEPAEAAAAEDAPKKEDAEAENPLEAALKEAQAEAAEYKVCLRPCARELVVACLCVCVCVYVCVRARACVCDWAKAAVLSGGQGKAREATTSKGCCARDSVALSDKRLLALHRPPQGGLLNTHTHTHTHTHTRQPCVFSTAAARFSRPGRGSRSPPLRLAPVVSLLDMSTPRFSSALYCSPLSHTLWRH